MQLVDHLSSILKQKSISVLKFSNESGISAYKVYKWIDKKGSPKHEDAQKVEEWLRKWEHPEDKLRVIRQDKGDKPPMTYTDISTTDSTAGMAHTAGPDQPQTLQEAVRAFLNVSEAINKQADVLVKLAGLIPNGPQKP